MRELMGLTVQQPVSEWVLHSLLRIAESSQRTCFIKRYSVFGNDLVLACREEVDLQQVCLGKRLSRCNLPRYQCTSAATVPIRGKRQPM
jgi:hypothetical protein